MLAALIVRGVAFEFRSKDMKSSEPDGFRWSRGSLIRWDRADRSLQLTGTPHCAVTSAFQRGGR